MKVMNTERGKLRSTARRSTMFKRKYSSAACSGIALPRYHLAALTASEAAVSAGEIPRNNGIFPASWISANFDVWIGAAEDVTAWDYLRRARDSVVGLGAPAVAEGDLLDVLEPGHALRGEVTTATVRGAGVAEELAPAPHGAVRFVRAEVIRGEHAPVGVGQRHGIDAGRQVRGRPARHLLTDDLSLKDFSRFIEVEQQLVAQKQLGKACLAHEERNGIVIAGHPADSALRCVGRMRGTIAAQDVFGIGRQLLQLVVARVVPLKLFEDTLRANEFGPRTVDCPALLIEPVSVHEARRIFVRVLPDCRQECFFVGHGNSL